MFLNHLFSKMLFILAFSHSKHNVDGHKQIIRYISCMVLLYIKLKPQLLCNRLLLLKSSAIFVGGFMSS